MEAMSEAHDRKDWGKVIAVGEAWVAARDGMHPVSCVHYAQALMAEGRYLDGLRWAEVAWKQTPVEDPLVRIAAGSAYAMALARSGQYDAAKRVLKRMVAIDPTALRGAEVIGTAEDVEAAIADAEEKQGHVLACVSSEWGRAWEMMESRLRLEKHALLPHMRYWDGQPTTERVAVLHEQGIGDCVLMGRWLPALRERCGSLVWHGPKGLWRWIAGLGIEVGTDQMAEVPESLVCWTMSIPKVAGLRKRRGVPHPAAPAALLAERARRQWASGLRIGLCWRGAKVGWHDFERSYPVDAFAPIWDAAPGATFVNLTHEAEVPEGLPFGRATFSDIYETGEVIARCDLVVSVDTSVVHLAGSLGVPTLALVPTVPDWRYQWPVGQTTPFYPSVTVIRRPTAWSERAVLAAADVVRRAASRLTAAA